jgi:hypothetical protein
VRSYYIDTLTSKGDIMNRLFTLRAAFILLVCTVFASSWCISLYAQGAPILEIDATALDFGESDTSKTFVITNGGEGTLTWSLSYEDDWLSTDITSGTLETGLSETVTVKVDRSQSGAAGLITGLITVTALDMIETVEISMVVPEEPSLMINPLALNFGAEDVVKELSIANSGWSVLEWTVSSEAEWIGLDKTSGSTEPGMVDAVYVSVERSAVEGLGTFSDAVAISSNGGDSSVPVEMEKQNHPPEIPNSSQPQDGATNQSLYTTLSCQGSDVDSGEGDELTYDIYFSTQEMLVNLQDSSVLVCSDMKVCYCDPGTGSVGNDTTYYWKVVAKDSYGEETASAVWSFSTESSVNFACPAATLGLGSKHYTSLRRLRDEILIHDQQGRDYIANYYRHAWELFILFLFQPELRMEGRKLAEQLYSVSESLLENGEVSLRPKLVKRIINFLTKVSQYTTPELERVIKDIKADLTQNRLQSLGIVTAEN